jgi:hypothetical protein
VETSSNNTGYTLWMNRKILWMASEQSGIKQRTKQGRPKAALYLGKAALAALFSPCAAYAVSPYTVTVMSTNTSVCNATLTVLSPVCLIGPLGMRTCAFAIL